jgi:hypothetical protein
MAMETSAFLKGIKHALKIRKANMSQQYRVTSTESMRVFWGDMFPRLSVGPSNSVNKNALR